MALAKCAQVLKATFQDGFKPPVWGNTGEFGAYLTVLRKRFAMTLHILGIAVDEIDNQQPECKANPVDQFWLAASDVLIEIVQRQPDIQPIIDAAIDAGGDIEITAHNQGGKISFALAEPSGLRHVLLADASQLLQP
jgi:hypothetical protein